MRPLAAVLLDRRFLLWTAAWTAVALVVFGLVSAIVPNPIFGRSVPPEPFAIVVWLVSAPLMGLLAATYVVPAAAAPASAAARPLTPMPAAPAPAAGAPRDGSLIASVAGLGAFLAIGCPLCNKVVLLVLGASGAMSVWAPIQPIVGAASVALLAATVAWRLRRRAAGDACRIPVPAR